MSKRHILICEDDEGIMDVMNIVLTEKGYSVKIVSNGREIFQHIDQKKPDMILVDLWMPEITGDEIVRELKKNLKTKNIPVIIVAANRRTSEIAKAAGADGYLKKPFDISELEDIVKLHTGGPT